MEQDRDLLKRINDLEKSLEALEAKAGFLNDEIKSVRENITAVNRELRGERGVEPSASGSYDVTGSAVELPVEIAPAEEKGSFRDAAAAAGHEAAPSTSAAAGHAATPNTAAAGHAASPNTAAAGHEAAPSTTAALRNAAAKRTKPVRREGTGGLEQFIGRNAMGIGASVLVFIAMVMFATILMPYMGQELKCAAMYIFSFILIGIGEWIYRRQKNGYLILSACGTGALYISIVATHVYFRFIDMIPLYALLLLWMAYVSYLGLKRSLVFVIVGQIGIVMAIVMSAFGIDTPLYLYLRFAFLMISEGLYYAVFFRSGYKYNLVNTIGLICALLAFDTLVYDKYLSYSYSANMPAVIIVLLSIIICAGAACRLISISDSRKRTAASAVISLGGGLAVLLVCYFLKDSMYNLGYLLPMLDAPLMTSTAWCYLPLTLYLAAVLCAIFRKEKKEKHDLSIIEYIAFGAFLLSILLLPKQIAPMIAAAVLFSLVAYNFKADRKDLYVLSLAPAWLGILLTPDAGSLYAPVFMMILVAAQMVYSRTNNPFRRFFVYELCSYLTMTGFLFVLTPELLEKLAAESRFTAFCAQTVLIIALQLIVKRSNWISSNENRLGFFHFANLFFMIITSWGISYADGRVQVIIATALAAVLYSINLGSLMRINENFGAYIAGKYSVLAGVLLFHLNVSSQIYSIVYLIAAIICVIIGFRFSNKSIRLYGLILSMLSIVKLILIDISYSNTLMRAVSFLISGLLCFGISLVYNHIDKQQKKKTAQPLPEESEYPGGPDDSEHLQDE